MPYSIGERGSYGCSGYPVIKDDDKTVMGCHETMAQAQNQITAINMSEAEQGKKRIRSGVEGFHSASEEVSVMGVGIKNPDPWPGTRIKTDSGMGTILPASNRSSLFREPKKNPRRSISGVGGNPSGSVATTGGGSGMGTKSNYNDDTGNWFNARPNPEASGVQHEVDSRNNIGRVIGKETMEIKEGDFVMGPTVDGMVYGMVEHIMWEGGTLGTPGTEYAMESMPPENPAMSVRVYEETPAGEWPRLLSYLFF
jgi:hypothetical protein